MKRIAWTVAVAALIPAATSAQGFGVDPAATWKLLQKYDKNADGSISLTEYGRGEDKFARFDKNGDGVLSAADFERGARRAAGERGKGRGNPGQRRGNRGGNARGNRGGAGGNRMVMWAAPELAKAADTDHSGDVTTAEWKAFTAGLNPDEEGRIERSALPFGSGAMGSRITGAFRDIDAVEEAYEQLDKDGDGALSREEMGPLPVPGEAAPDFELPFAKDKTKTMKLSAHRGDKPVALIFGSYT